MRKELMWYANRNKEVNFIGIYYGIDKGKPLFKHLTNTETEQTTKEVHIKFDEMIYSDDLDYGQTYYIRGYIVWYKRIKDETWDLRIDEAIIERI